MLVDRAPRRGAAGPPLKSFGGAAACGARQVEQEISRKVL
jgi:hypothetical protein